MDLGQSQRGVDMGPSAIRYAGLANSLQNLGHTIHDAGNITIPGHHSLKNTSLQERLIPISQACETAYYMGKEAIRNKEIPIFLGGDHSASIGTVGGVTHDKPVGLIWVDAHGDFNTPESSTSCNVHGMALATLMGKGAEQLINIGRPGPKVSPENVVIIGVRDVDPEEKLLLKESGITVYTMRDIDEASVHGVLVKALKKFQYLPHLHLSLDMDVIDPNEAPGVGTPCRGGLTYREAQLIMETIADTGKLHSLDIMEVNPILDISNRTAQMAVSLAASLFGKSIL